MGRVGPKHRCRISPIISETLNEFICILLELVLKFKLRSGCSIAGFRAAAQQWWHRWVGFVRQPRQ